TLRRGNVDENGRRTTRRVGPPGLDGPASTDHIVIRSHDNYGNVGSSAREGPCAAGSPNAALGPGGRADQAAHRGGRLRRRNTSTDGEEAGGGSRCHAA